nr:hypothetical protein [Mycobacterium sp. E3298]
MASVQTMTIPQFLNSRNKKVEEDRIMNKMLAHLKKHKIKYNMIGTTIIVVASAFLIGAVDIASAAQTNDAIEVFNQIPDSVQTSSSSVGIDAGGRRIYSKLVNIGKWIIIVKGGFDTLMNMVKGDSESAKKSFFSYIIVYMVLLGLPFCLDQVDSVFSGLGE